MPSVQVRRFRVGGELVDEAVELRDRKQLAELLGKRINFLEEELEAFTGGKATVAVDVNIVLHGDTIPDGLEEAMLHRDLTGADLHEPKPHAPSHNQGESDALDVGVPVSIGTVNAEGTASNYARRDHVHAGASPDMFTDSESLDGQCNGLARVFTLSEPPSPAVSLLLFVSFAGLGALSLWVQTAHYTLVSDTITLAAGVPTPPAGTLLRAYYRTA